MSCLVTHGTKKKNHAVRKPSTSLEDTRREGQRCIATCNVEMRRRKCQRVQARNGIFDEDKSGDDDDTPLWHQKYSEGVWAKDRCEDGLTLEEVIEERTALPVSISERRKTPTVSMKDYMSLDTRWSLLLQ